MKWIVIVSFFVVVYIGMYVHHIIARRRMRQESKLKRIQMFNEMSKRLYRFTSDDIWLYRL